MPVFSPYEQTAMRDGPLRQLVNSLQVEHETGVKAALHRLQSLPDYEELRRFDVQVLMNLQFSFLDTPDTAEALLGFGDPSDVPPLPWLVAFTTDSEEVAHRMMQAARGMVQDMREVMSFIIAANRHLSPPSIKPLSFASANLHGGHLFNPNTILECDTDSLARYKGGRTLPIFATAALNKELVTYYSRNVLHFGQMMHTNPYMSKELLFTGLIGFSRFEGHLTSFSYLSAVLRTVSALDDPREQVTLARYAFDLMERADRPVLTQNIMERCRNSATGETLLTALKNVGEEPEEDIQELSPQYFNTLLPTLFTASNTIKPSSTILDALSSETRESLGE